LLVDGLVFEAAGDGLSLHLLRRVERWVERSAGVVRLIVREAVVAKVVPGDVGDERCIADQILERLETVIVDDGLDRVVVHGNGVLDLCAHPFRLVEALANLLRQRRALAVPRRG